MGAQEKKIVKRHRRHNLKERFEIVKTLGQGTYGKVKLVIENSTETKYAIKSIRKNKIKTEQDLIRVRREIEIMATLSHPNITVVHEVFENKDRIVLVMEYAEGGEMYDYINERQGLLEEEARKFFRQITAAVHYLHSNGVVHRDLKLENILLDGECNVKIADFGLSNVYGGNRLLNTFCGSPLYASPEIINGQPYCGPEVDCWSLGVVLYTLVYRAMPFDGSDFKKLQQQITHGDYLEPKNPSDASGLIRQLLCTSVAGRATVADICNHWWVNFGYDHSPAQIGHRSSAMVNQGELQNALQLVSQRSLDQDVFQDEANGELTFGQEQCTSESQCESVHVQDRDVFSDQQCNTHDYQNSYNDTDSSVPHECCSSPNTPTHSATTAESLPSLFPLPSHHHVAPVLPLKGILKKPRSERPRRNSGGSTDLQKKEASLASDQPEKKRRPQSDCFVDATWLHLVPDSELVNSDVMSGAGTSAMDSNPYRSQNEQRRSSLTKPVFDSTKKPKRGILKNKNSQSNMGQASVSVNQPASQTTGQPVSQVASQTPKETSRSDSGCIIDDPLNLYTALENFGEVELPYKSREHGTSQRDSAYGGSGDSRKASCGDDGSPINDHAIYGFTEIANVLDQIANFDVVASNNCNTQSTNTKCSSANSSGDLSLSFSRPESAEFDQTPSTSSELLELGSAKTEPIRYRNKKPLKGILKRNSKSKREGSWRYSLGSQGSNSSADILDFSYDSCDGDQFMQEFCTVPIPLNDGDVDSPSGPENSSSGEAKNDTWSEFEVLPWRGVKVPLNDSIHCVDSPRSSGGSFTGKSIEHLVQVMEKLESDTNQLTSSYNNEKETVGPQSQKAEMEDEYHDYANVPSCDSDEEDTTISMVAPNQSSPKQATTPCEVPPPLPTRPPPIGGPPSPMLPRPDTPPAIPPPLPETPPPPFKSAHALGLFDFDMLEFEQSAADLMNSSTSHTLEPCAESCTTQSLFDLAPDLTQDNGCGDVSAGEVMNDLLCNQPITQDAITPEGTMYEGLLTVGEDEKERHRLSDLIADLQECAQEGGEALAEPCSQEPDEKRDAVHIRESEPNLRLDSDITDTYWYNQNAFIKRRRSKVRRQMSVPVELIADSTHCQRNLRRYSVERSAPDQLASSPEFLHCIDIYNLEVAAYLNGVAENNTKGSSDGEASCSSIPQSPSGSSQQLHTAQVCEAALFTTVGTIPPPAVYKLPQRSSSESSDTSTDSDVLYSGAGELPQLYIEEDDENGMQMHCPGVDNFGDVSCWLVDADERDGNGDDIFLQDDHLTNQPCSVISDGSRTLSFAMNGDCSDNSTSLDSLREKVFTPIQKTKCTLDDIMRRIDLLGAKIDTELQTKYGAKIESPFVDRKEAEEVCLQALKVCRDCY